MTGSRTSDRVAIVTGAGRGMGSTHALALAASGCRVVVNDLDADAAGEVVREITDRGGVAVVDGNDIVHGSDAMVSTAVDSFGRLDVLVNNAGVLGVTPFSETTPASWYKVFDVHLKGTVEATRSSWAHLLASPSGRLINVSSVGMLGNPGFSAYSAAKAAVFGFTKSLALEATGSNATVNCVLPSAWTRMSQAIPDPGVREVMSTHFGPERVSAFVAWLAHPDNRVHNEAFQVGGGWAARVRFGMGPGGAISSTEPTDWFGQQDALMAPDAGISPVDTSADLFGLEISRVAGDVRFAGGPVEFERVDFQ